MNAPAILTTTTVHDLLHREPSTQSVFSRHGVDTCCGGGLTLAEAARHAGASLEALLADLSELVEVTPPR